MGRVYLAMAVCALLFAIGYGLGTFAESYTLNQCYAMSLSTLAEQGDHAAAAKSDAALLRFRELVRSLPLAGPRTDCRRVELAIDVPLAPLSGSR
ncbi:MAG: hypothetical protein ACRETB_09455 [Steroidobacteraceae bacterium]